MNQLSPISLSIIILASVSAPAFGQQPISYTAPFGEDTPLSNLTAPSSSSGPLLDSSGRYIQGLQGCTGPYDGYLSDCVATVSISLRRPLNASAGVIELSYFDQRQATTLVSQRIFVSNDAPGEHVQFYWPFRIAPNSASNRSAVLYWRAISGGPFTVDRNDNVSVMSWSLINPIGQHATFYARTSPTSTITATTSWSYVPGLSGFSGGCSGYTKTGLSFFGTGFGNLQFRWYEPATGRTVETIHSYYHEGGTNEHVGFGFTDHCNSTKDVWLQWRKNDGTGTFSMNQNDYVSAIAYSELDSPSQYYTPYWASPLTAASNVTMIPFPGAVSCRAHDSGEPDNVCVPHVSLSLRSTGTFGNVRFILYYNGVPFDYHNVYVENQGGEHMFVSFDGPAVSNSSTSAWLQFTLGWQAIQGGPFVIDLNDTVILSATESYNVLL